MSGVFLANRKLGKRRKGSTRPEFLEKLNNPFESYSELPYREIVMPEETAIYRYGDRADVVYVIESGAVVLIRESLSQGGFVREECAGICGLGDAFGALYGFPIYHEEAMALTEIKVRIYMPDLLPKKLLFAELKRQVILSREILSILQGDEVREKLARLLLILESKGIVDENGGIPLTQEALGAVIMSNRATVARTLGDMRLEGMVESERRSITITDHERLARLAGYC